tara:strand:- start:416 stop:604 length:189 start_codon:yes stop_codon:yes gene_type:complete
MAKKCIICDGDASFLIKDSNESYCETCAKEYFSDLTLLQTVDEESAKIKQVLEDKIQQEDGK